MVKFPEFLGSPTYIMRHHTTFSRPGDQARGICAQLEHKF